MPFFVIVFENTFITILCFKKREREKLLVWGSHLGEEASRGSREGVGEEMVLPR